MSASEKLKALEGQEWRGVGPEVVLADALPQIVAVVEAAEQHEHGTSMEIALQIGEATCPIDEALAALEQALPNPQGKD